MAHPDQQVVADYRVALTSIRDRLLSARQCLEEGVDARAIELAAIDLRFALEGLLLSGLITHKADLGDVTKALSKADANDARKRVEKVNPDWWPNPQDIAQGGPYGVNATAIGHHRPDFLTPDEWGRNFGTVSDLLHARNPFAARRDGPHVMHKQLAEIADRMWRLLKAHTLSTGEGGFLLLARFDETIVQVDILTKISDIPADDTT